MLSSSSSRSAKNSQQRHNRSRSLRANPKLKPAKSFLPPLSNPPPIEPVEIPHITWDDFSAIPDRNSPWAAHTYWDIRYWYRAEFTKGGQNIQMNVTCKLNSNTSWVKRREDKLLSHERGHYLIGWICALEFKKRVKETRLSPLYYATEIRTIFKETLDEYLQWEILYDHETDHYKNTANQLKWNIMIAKRLDQLREYLENP